MNTKQLMIGLAGSALLATGAQAAFVVDANGGPATATNFSFGGDTTSATASAASAAVGLSGTSIFGGDGVNSPDTYVFSYTPGTDVDNFSPAAGSLLGSTTGFGTEIASGLVGGVSGTYNVYISTVQSTNVNAAGSTVTVNGDGGTTDVIAALDFNNGGTGPDLDPGAAFVGGANESWFLIGTVDLTAGNTYTVTVEANANTFVSQRTAGVMWELVPEPGSLALLSIGGLAVLRRRR